MPNALPVVCWLFLCTCAYTKPAGRWPQIMISFPLTCWNTRFIHTSRLRIVSFTARSRSALIHSFNEPQLRLVACCSQAVFAPACNQRAISTRRQSALPRPRVSKPQGIAVCHSLSVIACLSFSVSIPRSLIACFISVSVLSTSVPHSSVDWCTDCTLIGALIARYSVC